MKTYSLAASLRRYTLGGWVDGLMLGYQRCTNENEARESFMCAIEAENPEFSIIKILVLEIPDVSEGIQK